MLKKLFMDSEKIKKWADFIVKYIVPAIVAFFTSLGTSSCVNTYVTMTPTECDSTLVVVLNDSCKTSQINYTTINER